MDFFSFLALFGGLALFLYGVSLMGGALEAAALGRTRRALSRLAGSPLRGVLLGAAVTAAVQSSSAATVIVVGLAGAGAVSLRQAIGIIMGANIGTTVTAHLLSLGRMGAALAPVAVILGTGITLAAKKNRPGTLGQLLLGFGILFTGMLQMEAAVAPLRELPAFIGMFRSVRNPLLGVLAGAGVTAVIQSSSASVGILQAVASTGAVSWGAAVPIILGQNIGTCVTPLLAGVGGSRGAKRAGLAHLLLNLLGTGLFLAAIYGTGRLPRRDLWGEPVTKAGIAWFHTFFNVAVTAVFLPFMGGLERLVCFLVPDERPDRDSRQSPCCD